MYCVAIHVYWLVGWLVGWLFFAFGARMSVGRSIGWKNNKLLCYMSESFRFNSWFI